MPLVHVSWSMVFDILTLTFVMLTMFLHLSKLDLVLGSVADFSKIRARAITSERDPCLAV